MEVYVTPETAKKLKDLATTSGRAPEDIVEDALAGYLEEVASVRKTLDSRYDDLKIGRMSGYAFHPDAFADLDEIWEYIAHDNVDAADRVLADIHSTLTTLAGSP